MLALVVELDTSEVEGSRKGGWGQRKTPRRSRGPEVERVDPNALIGGPKKRVEGNALHLNSREA